VTPLDIQISALGRHTLVTPWGELDVTNAERLAEPLHKLIGESAGTAVIVHLAELEFCDTTGLSVLINAARAAVESGIPYMVAGAQGRVARVLHLTGLESAPGCCPTSKGPCSACTMAASLPRRRRLARPADQDRRSLAGWPASSVVGMEISLRIGRRGPSAY